MTGWRYIKRHNPVGPDYPEAGRDYVLRSEAEDRIEAAEAKLSKVLDKFSALADAFDDEMYSAIGDMIRTVIKEARKEGVL